ncbi:HAD family hydrolase [Azohydromonas lata]|uniref:HAD family hydrolase n=1 Tax=Azohydromonas lata TaxID=45677 RepID=UPI000835E781|nr:HAD family phosphatase [Azohydromonas lata]
MSAAELKPVVIWDVGAVLLRWRPAVLLQRVLPRHAHDEASALALARRFFVEGGDWGAYDRGDVEEAALAQRIAHRTGLTEADVHTVIQAVPDELQPLPDSVELLHALRQRGLKQYFFSNMPLGYAAHIEKAHGFFGLFHGGLFSARVRRMKPEREFYELAHERFNLAGRSAIFIDDSPANIQAAREFGWNAVLFRDIQQVAGELKALGMAC